MLLLIYVPPVAGLVNGLVALKVGLPVFLHLFPNRSGEQIGRVAAVAAATIGAMLIVIAITAAAIVGAVRLGRELNHIGYC